MTQLGVQPITFDAAELQRQLDDPQAGDVIELPDMHIAGHFVINRSVILRGGNAQHTILDGEGRGTVLSIEGEGITVRIEGVAIVRGLGMMGAGISVDDGARVELVECLLQENLSPEGMGGAIGVDCGTVVVEQCTVTNNEAHLGGAVFAGGRARVELISTLFSGNGAVRGGALAVQDGADVDAWTCRFENNLARYEGHHFYARSELGYQARVVLANVVMTGTPAIGMPVSNHPRTPAAIVKNHAVTARTMVRTFLFG